MGNVMVVWLVASMDFSRVELTDEKRSAVVWGVRRESSLAE